MKRNVSEGEPKSCRRQPWLKNSARSLARTSAHSPVPPENLIQDDARLGVW